MNYTQILSSLFKVLSSQRFFRAFARKKRNNKSWIPISLIGITILGIVGGRNQKLRQPLQNGYKKVSKTVVNKFQANKNPFQPNFNMATEIAEELNPDTLGIKNRDDM